MIPEPERPALAMRVKVFLWVGPAWGVSLGSIAATLSLLSPRDLGLGDLPSLIVVGVMHGIPFGLIVGIPLGVMAAFAYEDEGLARFARPIILSSAIGALPVAPFIGPISALTGAIGYITGLMIVKSDPHPHSTSPHADSSAPGNAHSAQEEMK